jgi:hypothetical protein
LLAQQPQQYNSTIFQTPLCSHVSTRRPILIVRWRGGDQAGSVQEPQNSEWTAGSPSEKIGMLNLVVAHLVILARRQAEHFRL